MNNAVSIYGTSGKRMILTELSTYQEIEVDVVDSPDADYPTWMSIKLSKSEFMRAVQELFGDEG